LRPAAGAAPVILPRNSSSIDAGPGAFRCARARLFLAPIAIHLAVALRHRFVRRDRVTSWVIDGAPI